MEFMIKSAKTYNLIHEESIPLEAHFWTTTAENLMSALVLSNYFHPTLGDMLSTLYNLAHDEELNAHFVLPLSDTEELMFTIWDETIKVWALQNGD